MDSIKNSKKGFDLEHTPITSFYNMMELCKYLLSNVGVCDDYTKNVNKVVS
jgi:hypothetical protein